MKRVLRDNGLSIALFGLFLVSLMGQSLTGWREHNHNQRDHHRPAVGFCQYLKSGDFIEATFENWESEFMQMAAFLVLSAVLIQRGAAESKKPPEEEDAPEGVAARAAGAGRPRPDAPWPVQRGGLALILYKRSLSIALTLLFAVSFVFHGLGGRAKFNDEASAHGQPSRTLMEYMTSSTFWFESFQNWQSEFLSVGVLVVFSIFLRQSGSPESKAVEAPHRQTGAE